MKKYRILDRIFMFIGFTTALISAILAYVNSEPFVWQLGCVAWISVVYLKQLTIESLEDDK